MQQFMMDRIKDNLDFTNDTDWAAVQPLVQKVLDAQRAAARGNMGRMFRRRNNNGDNGGDNGGGRGGGVCSEALPARKPRPCNRRSTITPLMPRSKIC